MQSNSFLTLLLKKWKYFLVIGILAGSIGFIIAMLTKPKFQSRLSFALDAGNSENSLSGAFNLASQFGYGLGGSGNLFDGDNIIEIMKSRRIIEKVLLTSEIFNNKKYTLASYYLEITELRKTLDKKERLAGIDFPVGITKDKMNYLQDSILNFIYLKMEKEDINPDRPDKKLSIYEIQVTSYDEKFSKVFTDRLVEEAGIFYTEITSRKEKETVDVLALRVDSLKNNVGSSLMSKAQYVDANINPAFSVALANPQMQQFNISAYGEAYKELFKNLELAKYQYIKKIPLLQIIDKADYPMEKIKSSKLKTALLFAILANAILMLFLWINFLKNRLEQSEIQIQK